ncbi:alpha/beta hydrolase [bacterium]|nr:MAG: alpha/beta hydrolase [bacterium]
MDSGSPSLTPRLKGKPDPQMAAVLNSLKSLKGKPIEKLTPAKARKQPTATAAVINLLKMQGKSTAPEKVGSVTDVKVPGPAGAPEVTVRVYKPLNAPSGPLPIIVYFHGGGFVIASVSTYDASCRSLANKTGAIVASVAYRYAPENRLPAAHEDSYAATQWIMKNGAGWGGDTSKVAVAGESAGGNLATDMCLMAKMRGGKMPVHQLLVYPVVQGKTTPSYSAYYSAKPLNTPMMKWFFKNALPSPAFGKTALASPLNAPDNLFKGLPPATVIAAEIDPLQSEGMSYVKKLQKNGIPVKYRIYTGVTHEFFGMTAVLDKAKAANTFAAAELKSAFGK